MKINTSELIKLVAPTIASVGIIWGVFNHYNVNVDNRIKDLEHNCIKKSDVDERINEKLVPIVQEIKYLRSDLSRGFLQVNEHLKMISEVRVKN